MTHETAGGPVELSIVMPCLNEAETLAACIGKAQQFLEAHGVRGEVVVADKGYDKKALVEEIESRGAEAAIPTRSNCKEQRAVDPHHYRERNLCERFWSKAKQYRRVATRYEKKAVNFLAFVKVAAMMIMLK